MITIQKTTAYRVNFHDSKGVHLMSLEEVERSLNDLIGAFIDGLEMGEVLGAREKLELHVKFRNRLERGGVKRLVEIWEAFKEARESE